jgi:hypothetical protein
VFFDFVATVTSNRNYLNSREVGMKGAGCRDERGEVAGTRGG